MADPDLDSGIVFDEQGYIHILHSTFFDVNPRIDHTVEEYVERILDTHVEAIEEQLGNVQCHLASDPQKEFLEINSPKFTNLLSTKQPQFIGKEEVTQQPPYPTLSKEKGRGKANGQAQKTYSSPRLNIPANHKCHGKTSGKGTTEAAVKGRTEEQKQVPKQNTQKPNRQPSSRNTKPSTGNRGGQQETEGIDRKPKGQIQTKKTRKSTRTARRYFFITLTPQDR
ncbi:hypothetical protein M5K25_014589 [Dendrobium thyrsiflorum]|uniref:Uncharacterized protein n=1 Tax=Dendrobium thyrsiflorum TaxID=117978 RepID=A0ABD0UNE7_DENTH